MISPLKIFTSLASIISAGMLLGGLNGHSEFFAIGLPSLAASAIAWSALHYAEKGVLITADSNLTQKETST